MRGHGASESHGRTLSALRGGANYTVRFVRNYVKGWRRVFLLPLILLLGAFALSSSRITLLRATGWALVANDPIGPVDVIIVSENAGGSGVLEAADLVQSGMATRVAVFADPPVAEDLEFIRRGVPYEDWAERSTMQLRLLGVPNVDRIPRVKTGSEAEAATLPAWCQKHKIRSMILVTTTDHSRRLRRLLRRSINQSATRVIVRPSRYSRFDPDRWWQDRGGIRTEMIELQKLLLDLVTHPFS